MTTIWDAAAGAPLFQLPPGTHTASGEVNKALAALPRVPSGTAGRFFTFHDDLLRSASRRTAKHAQLREGLPFLVNLDGRVITLSPAVAPVGRHEAAQLSGHGADVTDADMVIVNGAPTALVSSSVDGTVRLWNIGADADAATGSTTATASVAMLSTSAQPEGTFGAALAATADEQVAILDLDSGDLVARLACASGSVLAATCCWVPGLGNTAITLEAGGYARVWRLPSGGQAGSFGTYVTAVSTDADRLPLRAACIPFPGRPLAITCGHGRKAVLWDVVGERIHGVLGKHVGLISALACGVTPGGTFVAATAGSDNRVNVWNVVSGRRIGHLKMVRRTQYLADRNSGIATEASLVANGRRRFIVAVLCEDGRLRIFRRRSSLLGYQRVTLDTEGATSLVIISRSNGRLLAVTGGRDGRLRVWDFDAVLRGASKGDNDAAILLDIETEVAITSLAVVGDDTVITSARNGLAAFRLNPERLASRS
jgi:WD40 repeat protein